MAKIDENDYNSSEDEDYLPHIDENNEVEDADDLEDDDVDDDLVLQSKQNGTTTKKSDEVEKDKEAEKERINALWEDFLSDTNTTTSSSKNQANDIIPTVSNSKIADETLSNKKQTTTKRKFTAQKTGEGLANVAKLLSKNKKMSVLDKSNVDWKTFVDKEGIAEDLKIHSRSKESYLDKQDFLLRADFSKFQEEKALRQLERGKQFK